MNCNGFKGGTGTAPRKLPADQGGYTIGVLVQCNYGSRYEVRIAGVPEEAEQDSIIVAVATDAPLTPDQLKRIAKRVSLGLGRAGTIEANGSGDIFIAFSTANPGADEGNSSPTGRAPLSTIQHLIGDRIDFLFLATIQATDEAVDNALIAADTMTGADYWRSYAILHDQLREILRKHNRLIEH